MINSPEKRKSYVTNTLSHTPEVDLYTFVALTLLEPTLIQIQPFKEVIKHLTTPKTKKNHL